MRSLPLVLLLVACGAEPAAYDPWVWSEVDVEVLPAFDPELDGFEDLDIALTVPTPTDPGCTVAVTATTAAGLRVDLGTHPAPTGPAPAVIRWDGTAGDGLPVDPGAVQIAADLWCSRTLQGFGEARTHVVRLGLSAVDLGIEDDTAQIPLAFHKTDLRTRGLTVVPADLVEWRSEAGDGELADLDTDDGAPRPGPAPWRDAAVPPWGGGAPDHLARMNLPVAYPAGAGFSLAVTAGSTAVSARTGAPLDARGPLAGRGGLPPIRIVSDDLVALGDAAWSPGAPARFRAVDGLLPDTLGLHTLDLTWRFEVLVDDAWVPLPGALSTTHDVWILAGPTAVIDGADRGASPAASWVGVLADVQPAVQGLPADDIPAVMDALRDHLHTDPWIVYNPSDSAYSSFSGPYIFWDRIWVEMSDYLDRQQGLDLYCHSVACVLSSQANHLGIEAEYITMTHEDRADGSGPTFRTWLTRAASSETWRQWSFNSHGIVEVDGKVWDAAVDIDIDDRPGEQPVEAWSPRGVTFEEYQEILSANRLVIVNRGRCDNY